MSGHRFCQMYLWGRLVRKDNFMLIDILTKYNCDYI